MRPSFARYRRSLERGSAADPFAQRVTRTGRDRSGDYVLYWMQSSRRLHANPALEFAISEANRRGVGVVIYESLRPDYPGANDRIHHFVLGGVAGRRASAHARGLRYVFFLPRNRSEARGVVARLAARAALLVTDEYPTGVVAAQTARLVSRGEHPVALVDGNGLLPMRLFPKAQYNARFFRDIAHRNLEELWTDVPLIEPKHRFGGELQVDDWTGEDLDGAVAACEIDHGIRPVRRSGSREEALRNLEQFVANDLSGYASGRNRHPEQSSGMSPWLHFGVVGMHEIARRVLFSDGPQEDIDAFLEEAVIRRELSFNMCFHRPDHDSLAVLPDWAKKTLDVHRRDRRKPLYTATELEAARTHDEVWNLSQRALLASGTIPGYLRMLWGKKIIEWSASPEEAHRLMIALHERYAIDGRDPNTHAGVLWCFGMHDRPWGERPIFGMVRWMSSDSTARKVDMKAVRKLVEREETWFSSASRG